MGKAREGLFPASIVADVGSERLQRFFSEEPGFYRVKKELRELNQALERKGIARDLLFQQRADERDDAMEKLRSQISRGKNEGLWMEAAFETLDEAMMLVSTDKKVLAFNPAAEKLLGYSADELVGGPVEKLHLDREHHKEFIAKLGKAL